MPRPRPARRLPYHRLRSLRDRIRRLLRRRGVYAVACALLIGSTASAVWHLVDAAQTGAARYGAPIDVVVARSRLAAGTSIGTGDVEVRKLPRAAVPPDSAGASLDAVAGRVVRAEIEAGEPVSNARLAERGNGGLATLVGPGRRGVAVPRGRDPLPLRRGDHVDVDAIDPHGTSTVLARAAEVVEVDDHVATIALDADDAGSVAESVTAGVAQLVLVGR